MKESSCTEIKEDQAYLLAQEYYVAHKALVKAFWDEALAEVEHGNDLNPLLTEKVELDDKSRVDQVGEAELRIEGELYQQVKALTSELGITTNTMAQFLWHYLIRTYTQDTQTIVGMTTSGRDIPVNGIDKSVGLYINTLPLVVDWKDDVSIQEKLAQIHSAIIDVNSHSYANLAGLQKDGKRLFHSLLVYENYSMPKAKEEEAHQLEVQFIKAIEKVDYPLSVMVFEYEGVITLKLKYDETILTSNKANDHLVFLERVLRQVTKTPGQAIKDLQTLSKEEYQTIVYDWNQTDRDYPKDKTIY
ncbi:condensation domain-containing protein, partial [Cysteiniphilum litorale]|uniref:condensation domain-containing protein n=1 Tax=Cysteiniphilum litorale TaxID=2056700 RepID=UPI003F885663